jgi:hypothetical protein
MQITMEQVKELADRYEQCGLGASSSGRFLRSITTEGRMPRGRGISWLEELITKGDPSSVSELVAEIEDLALRSKRPDTIAALNDMLSKVRAGWTLTNHKKSELERLRKQVNDDLPDLELDEQQVKLLHGLIARKRCMSPYYWASRPVISGRLDEIFIRWTVEKKVSPDDWDFVMQSFKTCVSELNSAKHRVGSLCWTRSGEPVTVASAKSIDASGKVVVDVLTTTGIRPMPIERLLTRAPK